MNCVIQTFPQLRSYAKVDDFINPESVLKIRASATLKSCKFAFFATGEKNSFDKEQSIVAIMQWSDRYPVG